MAGTSSSLVVKISADINDFLKQLDSMTKGVDKAADRVAALGDKLTIGLTLPLAAAGVAMAKFAADADDTSARFDRVFGTASDSVKASLEAMTKVIPETVDELEKLAVQTDAMLRGMEIAPQTAATMSASIVKLAGDLAAFNHIPIQDALNALESGLAGRTRSLLEMGVAISKVDITQEAYREGILHTGNTLTEAGTAQAAFNLIMQRTSLLQGQAAITAGDQSKSWQFLLRDVKDLAVSLGQFLVPAFVAVIDVARDLVNWINSLSDSTKTFILVIGALLTVVGPILSGFANLVKGIVAVRAAFTLLTAGSAVATGIAELANPIGIVVAAVVSLTLVLGGLYLAWKKFTGGPDDSVLNTDKSLAASVAGPGGSGKSGPTEQNTKSPFAQLEANAALAQTAFARAADYGTNVTPVLAKINQYHAEAVGYIRSGAAAFTEESVKAQELADKLQLIRDAVAVSNAPTTQAGNALLKGIQDRAGGNAGLLGAQSAANAAAAYGKDLATRGAASQYAAPYDARTEATIASRKLAGYQGSSGSVNNDLDLRAALVGLPDGFNAAKQASVEYAEEQRKTQEDTALAFETIKIKLGPLGSALDGFSSGLQNLVVNLYNAASQIGQQILDRIGGGGKNAASGRGIGGLIGGIAGSFFGPVGTAVGSFLGGAIGGQVGGVIDHNTKSTDTNTTALATLNQTINTSISNIPQFFKLGSYEYAAAPTVPFGVLGGAPNPGSPSSPGPGGTTGPYQAPLGYGSGDVHFNGPVTLSLGNVKDMSDLYQQIKQKALQDRGTGSTSGLAFSRA